jgi:hypothetical protein
MFWKNKMNLEIMKYLRENPTHCMSTVCDNIAGAYEDILRQRDYLKGRGFITKTHITTHFGRCWIDMMDSEQPPTKGA